MAVGSVPVLDWDSVGDRGGDTSCLADEVTEMADINMIEIELIKVCPFCGSDDVRIEEDCPTGFTEIYCADCGVSITRTHKAEAINAWNRRT